MSESSAFLVRSFSVPSPTSSEEKKRNSIKRALTSSISFGRFMTESLDWERFSAFNQKRYLEEAERYSKPGSVAEKKAYFEAHYKRKRAAALVEQQNAEPSNLPETNATNMVEDNSSRSESARGESYLVSEKTKEEEVQNRDTIVSVSQRELEDSQLQGVEQVNKPLILMETSVELMDHIENDECVVSMSNQEDKTSQDVPSMNISEFTSAGKPEVYSTNLLINGFATKQVPPPAPVKPITSVRLGNNEKATLNSKNIARDSSNKKRATSTSLHMSINFAPCFGETQNTTSPGLLKNVYLMNKTLLKKTSNSFLPQTLTRASVNSVCNTPSENRIFNSRNFKTHGHSIQGSRMVDGKLQSLSTSDFKSSSTLGTNTRSVTASSSFTFKCEERVAKRKEFFQKLEQKLKSNGPDKRPHAKPQVKARNDLKDQLKATKFVDVPPKIESSSHFTKKTLNVTPYIPKIKERVPFKVQDNDPRPPWRFSTKADSSKDVTGKNNRPPICSAKSFPKKSNCENSSPNVQV